MEGVVGTAGEHEERVEGGGESKGACWGRGDGAWRGCWGGGGAWKEAEGETHLQLVQVCQVKDGVPGNLAEDGVLAVQLLGGIQGDEELASVAVGHNSVPCRLSSTCQQASAPYTQYRNTHCTQL